MNNSIGFKIISRTLIISFIFISTLISCRNNKPKSPDLISIPQLEYISKTKIGNSSQEVNITIDAFYLSNEISNKEYRDFTTWVKNHPDEILSKQKEVIVNKNPEQGKTKIYTVPYWIKMSDLLPSSIDSNAMYKIDKSLKNYFIDEKFDDYPVVGVSKNAAEFYCSWLILMETQIKKKTTGNTKLLIANGPEAGYYRLPLELEWEFAAKQPYKRTFSNDNQLHKVFEGIKNIWGLLHLHDNVSELVTMPNDTMGIIRGVNWKTTDSTKDRFKIHPDSCNGFTGFRVARFFEQFKAISK